MKTYTPQPGEPWPKELRLVYLSHAQFRQNASMRKQVRDIVTGHYEQGKTPGQTLKSYVEAFMNARGKGHALILDRKGNVYAHWNGIPVRTAQQSKTNAAWLGHMVVRAGNKLLWHFYNRVLDNLSNTGYTRIHGTYYSQRGQHVGEKLGGKNRGLTVRGKKHGTDWHRYWTHARPK